jgi:uncharacterized protein (TIGR01777 family)
VKVVIAGGSGLIGQALAARLLDQGHAAVVLTRGANVAVGRAVRWDGTHLGDWCAELSDADALVNLCGAGIGDARWSAARKRVILRSRTGPAELLARACAGLNAAPGTLIQASGVGFYGTSDVEWFSEESAPGNDYLAGLAREWEAAGAADWPADMRRVVARIGVVWSGDGGALGKLVLPFRLFVGGRLGSGTQPLSWIHIDDLVDAFMHLLFSSELRGPVNCCAPQAPSNSELAHAIGAALGRPCWLPAPAFALRLLLGEMADLLLQGQQVRPEALLEDGFKYRFATADDALADLLAAP